MKVRQFTVTHSGHCFSNVVPMATIRDMFHCICISITSKMVICLFTSLHEKMRMRFFASFVLDFIS